MILLRETYLEYSNSPTENSFCHPFLTIKWMPSFHILFLLTRDVIQITIFCGKTRVNYLGILVGFSGFFVLDFV